MNRRKLAPETKPLLKPCPKCRNIGDMVGHMGTGVMCLECGYVGPYDDPTGEKWNAMAILSAAEPTEGAE
jgi:ribosomal protein S27E